MLVEVLSKLDLGRMLCQASSSLRKPVFKGILRSAKSRQPSAWAQQMTLRWDISQSPVMMGTPPMPQVFEEVGLCSQQPGTDALDRAQHSLKLTRHLNQRTLTDVGYGRAGIAAVASAAAASAAEEGRHLRLQQPSAALRLLKVGAESLNCLLQHRLLHVKQAARTC